MPFRKTACGDFSRLQSSYAAQLRGTAFPGRRSTIDGDGTQAVLRWLAGHRCIDRYRTAHLNWRI